MMNIGIITQVPEIQINLDKDLYIEIAKEYEKLYIIDVSFDNKKKKIKLPKNFIYLKPNNYKELGNIFANKKFLCLNYLYRGFKNLRLLFFIKKFDIKHFYVIRSSTIRMNENLFIEKNRKLDFYLILFKKIFFKILAIFNLINNYEILFISTVIKKEWYHSNRNALLNKIFNTNNFFLYKKIVSINDKTYDLNYNYRDKKSKKIISFIDTTLSKPEKVSSLYKPNDIQKKIFYQKLRNILKFLSKNLRMNLVVCLHPKTPMNDVSKYFKGLKCLRYKTSEIIKKSFLSVYLSSTTISESIFLRKNILLVDSNLIGTFHSYRVKHLIKKFKLNSINVDKDDYLNLIKNIKFTNKMKTTSFLNLSKEINIKQKKTGIKKIITTLNRYNNYEKFN